MNEGGGEDLFFVLLSEENVLKILHLILFVRNTSYVVRIYVVFNTQVDLFVNISVNAFFIVITGLQKIRDKLLINMFKDFTSVL